MTYKTHEFAQMMGVSTYTIRYYDKEGMLPFVIRDANGYRVFTDTDVNIFKTILCLKQTGMPLKHIKYYIHLVEVGPETVEERLQMLEDHKQMVLEKQHLVTENLKGVQEKIDKYSDPDAKEVIRQELDYVKAEKQNV